MSDLTTLVKERRTVLLAEVAGLLHNLGKLDPNFLASMVTDQENAKEELMGHLLDIPSYHFQRFAAPDPGLLARGRNSIVGQTWETRADLAAALKDEFTDPTEHQAIATLIQSWEEGKKDHPFLAQVIESAWQFSAFHRANGPLYRCFSPARSQRLADLKAARQELQRTQQEIAHLDVEITTLGDALSQAAPHEKKALGIKFNALKKQRGQLETRQEQAEEKCRQIEHSIPDEEKEAQAQLEAQFRKITLQVGDEVWPLADLLSLFWDAFYYQPGGDGYKRQSSLAPWLDPQQSTDLPALLILSHGEVSGAEKKPVEAPLRQAPWSGLRIATAFGYEWDEVKKWILHDARHQLLKAALQACEVPEQERDEFLNLTRSTLSDGLGDTQWPINEITLWDYATTITALFKSAIAKAVLENRVPVVGEMAWRLLHLSFDGLGFLGQAHHVSDLLGRRAALDGALDAAQAVLETEFPVGNQVYRDEHGSIFVVADRPDLLRLTDADGTTLEQHVRAAFDATGLQGELGPEIKLSDPYPGQDLPLHQIIEERTRLQRPDIKAAQGWWPAPGQPTSEICTVCGLRPVGYPPDGAGEAASLAGWATAEKASRRKVCRVCLDRRGRRSQDWARNEKDAFHRTIWINEVADANGRAALIVGQFDLHGWLDGKLIATLRKNASFARIRRCWDTTQQFWQEVQTKTIPAAVGQVDWRLGIEVSNPDAMDADLGDYHVYDWPLGRGVALSVVWDPQRRCFIAADNLAYLAGPEQLGRLKKPTADQLRALYTVNGVIREKGSVPLEEPSGYGQPRRTLTQAENPEPRLLEDSAYVPTIPLLTEPATFMALVPADKAMAVMEKIYDKYTAEMGRVRDRLPLHLGLVVFPRATPLRAVLDAGRALLGVTSGEGERWEPWTVQSLDPDPWDEANPPDDGQRTITFDNGVTWQVPLLMGDEKTPDQWYAHCFKEDPRDLNEIRLDEHLVRVSQLQGDDNTIWVRPSTFDYVFLDTTGRRFEIAYNTNGQRLGHPGRPFDLEAIRDFPAIWKALACDTNQSRLKRTQLHALLELARTKAGDWGPGNGQAVNRLLRHALLRAAWPGGWKAVPAESRARLLAAVKAGWLPDLLDFYLTVLKMEPTE